jgi:importin subunit alpha-6/7
MTRQYMFNDRNANSQRRKREDEQVELRRQRTEELLNKKRASTAVADSNSTFEASRGKLFSDNLEDIYQGAYECRTSLSVESNPPIQSIIDSGLVPRFVDLLRPEFYVNYPPTNPLINKCRAEAAWVITNISSGTTEQTEFVVSLGPVVHLINMLSEPDEAIIDQSVWALGNIAGDCESMRDLIISAGALGIVINLIRKYYNSKDHIKLLRNLTWFLSNMNRGRNPPPTSENMKVTLAVIENLINLNDPDVVSDCFWCLSYIVDADTNICDLLFQTKIMERKYQLLTALTNQVKSNEYDAKLSKICGFAICPIIRTIGNIVTGTDQHTDNVINMNFLDFFVPIFYHYDNKKLPRVRKEICWIISNIAAGTYNQIKQLMREDIVKLVIDAVSQYELFIRKEALYALTNILQFCICNPEYLECLLNNRALTALQNLLDAVSNMPDLQIQILDSCKYALEAGEKIKQKVGDNPVVQLMIDSKLVDDIEELQDVANHTIVQKAYNIIVDFFDGEEDGQ